MSCSHPADRLRSSIACARFVSGNAGSDRRKRIDRDVVPVRISE